MNIYRLFLTLATAIAMLLFFHGCTRGAWDLGIGSSKFDFGAEKLRAGYEFTFESTRNCEKCNEFRYTVRQDGRVEYQKRNIDGVLTQVEWNIPLKSADAIGLKLQSIEFSKFKGDYRYRYNPHSDVASSTIYIRNPDFEGRIILGAEETPRELQALANLAAHFSEVEARQGEYACRYYDYTGAMCTTNPSIGTGEKMRIKGARL
jgi:hypothetical protein